MARVILCTTRVGIPVTVTPSVKHPARSSDADLRFATQAVGMNELHWRQPRDNVRVGVSIACTDGRVRCCSEDVAMRMCSTPGTNLCFAAKLTAIPACSLGYSLWANHGGGPPGKAKAMLAESLWLWHTDSADQRFIFCSKVASMIKNR